MRITMFDSDETSNGSHAKEEQDAEVAIQKLLDRKILVLLTFAADMQLDSSNYGIWKVMMEAILATYDLAPMVLTEFDRPDYFETDNLSAREKA
eukprot:c20001_g1_i1 orf=327-608(+)